MDCHSVKKKNEIMPFVATWMELEMIILSDINQKQISYDITYMESKKMIQMSLFMKQKETQTLKTDFGYQRGKVMGKMDWELGISIYTLLYIKWVINRDLLYTPGNFAR